MKSKETVKIKVGELRKLIKEETNNSEFDTVSKIFEKYGFKLEQGDISFSTKVEGGISVKFPSAKYLKFVRLTDADSELYKNGLYIAFIGIKQNKIEIIITKR